MKSFTALITRHENLKVPPTIGQHITINGQPETQEEGSMIEQKEG